MMLYQNLPPLSGVALLLVAGYFGGKLAQTIKFPSLIGYLLAGVVLGPSVLSIFSESQLSDLEFITTISLGCIAFIIGSELHLSSLKRLGKGVFFIILAESFLSFAAVTVGIYLLSGNLVLSMLFGAMAPASAPAGTVAVIQEYRARGNLTKTLYAVVGFDDALAVIIFGFVLAVTKMNLALGDSLRPSEIIPFLWQPIKEIGLSVFLGCLIGWCFTKIVQDIDKKPEQLILILSAVLAGAGLAEIWHLSPILVCMVVGVFFTNITGKNVVNSVRSALQQLMEVVFVLFFGLAGLHLDLTLLVTLGWVGLVYIIARIIGKLSGAWLGAYFFQMEDNIRHYLGFGILSQAGVAIGLALLIQQELAALPGTGTIGSQILTTITATSIVFEIIGPISAYYGLRKAGEIKGKE